MEYLSLLSLVFVGWCCSMDGTQAVTPKSAPFLSDKVKSRLLCAYAVIFLVLRAVPWKPDKYVLSFDVSWDLALHFLTAHGAKFGQNLIFTFGPLGFAYARTFYPDDYFGTLGIWTFLSVVLAITLFRFARSAFSHNFAVFSWLSLTIITIAQFADSFFFAFAICILCEYFLFSESQKRPSKISVLLAIALGVTASIKFTFVLSAVLCLAFISIDEVVRNKRIPILASISGATFLLIWLVCGQPLSLLVDFVRYSIEVTRGYSDTLALGSSYAQIFTTAFLGLTAFLAMWYSSFRQIKLRSLGFGLALGGVLFAVFKAAYVRHDPGHGSIAALGFTVLCFLLIACTYKDRTASKFQKLFAHVITASFLLIVIPWNFGAPVYSFPLLCVDAVLKSCRNATLVVGDLFSDQKNLAEFEQSLATIRKAAPFPALVGGVDAYPIDAKIIIANHLSYSPRPLLQSYQSYTTALLNADSRHLTATDAPEWLILSGKPWEDNWLPALNDGQSFLQFFSLYKEEKVVSDQVLLKRRTVPLNYHLELLKEFTAQLGEPVDLSVYKGKFLWAQITPELSLGGELARFCYHVLPLSISVEAGNFGIKKFVAPRALLSEGFLLSPFFDDSTQLFKVLQLKTSSWQDLSVSKIVLEDRNPKEWGAFRTPYKVKLFELKQ
ncbi:membrane protein [soil metagenome]